MSPGNTLRWLKSALIPPPQPNQAAVSSRWRHRRRRRGHHREVDAATAARARLPRLGSLHYGHLRRMGVVVAAFFRQQEERQQQAAHGEAGR